MQRDFHFYAIALLARTAGYSSRDALIIGYASQYTDDATENKPITLVDEKSGFELKFDPVRTQYTKALKANNWTVHKSIYIPFHFLPPLPLQYPELGAYLNFVRGPYDFVTQPDSPFARMLLKEAAKEPNERRRLCRLGIALHTYADTWSHQRFSGRENRDENYVEDPDYWDGNDWSRDSIADHIIERGVSLFADNTGHAEAAFLPDMSFLNWRYTNVREEVVNRPNPTEFLTAARRIYTALCEINPQPQDQIPWGHIRKNIAGCLAYRGSLGDDISNWELYLKVTRALEERCEEWRKTFGGYFEPPYRYNYNPLEWRRIALAPNVRPDPYFDDEYSSPPDAYDESWEEWDMSADYRAQQKAQWDLEPWSQHDASYGWDSDMEYDERDIDWDEWSHDERKFGKLKFPLKPNFPDSLWVHFHRAALRQRHLVMERLP